jgi:hypothetical protein
LRRRRESFSHQAQESPCTNRHDMAKQTYRNGRKKGKPMKKDLKYKAAAAEIQKDRKRDKNNPREAIRNERKAKGSRRDFERGDK